MKDKNPLPCILYVPNDYKGIFSDEFYEKLFEAHSRSAKPPKSYRIFNKGFIAIDASPQYGFSIEKISKLKRKGWNPRNHDAIQHRLHLYCGSLPVNYYL